MEHAGAVYHRELIFDSPSIWQSDVAGCEGKRVVVTLAVDRRKRSTKQNSYLWGVIYKYIADYTGYAEEEVHEWAKWKFLGAHEVKIDDDRFPIGNSTKKLNTVEFKDYTERLQRFAAEKLGLNIPSPGEDTFTTP